MNQDQRDRFDEALRRARKSAHGPGEFVGQESFMRASEIRSLAARAGITAQSRVLDLCCGVAGPGRLIAREFGCTYLGVDASAAAVRIARGLAPDLDCRFAVARIPPVPDGAYDVVLLFETMLAFREKEPLLRSITAALDVGGRFVFTLEEGEPLTDAERQRMPDADTVWLAPLEEMLSCLDRAGLRACWVADHTDAHQATVDSLLAAYEADAEAIAAHVGRAALDELLAAHRLWGKWLRQRRVRKLAVIAEKVP